MPPIKRIRIAQPKSDPITTGRGWLLSKIDELEASLKDYVIASGLVLRYHADLLQQQQAKNELSVQSAQPPKELLERIQQNNYAWIRAELDEYLRLAQAPELVSDNATSSVAGEPVEPSSSSSVPPKAPATVPASAATSTSATTTTAPTGTDQAVPETVARQPIEKNQPTGEQATSAQSSSQQADPAKSTSQSSVTSLPPAVSSAAGSAPAPLTVAAAVAAASSANNQINSTTNSNNDGADDVKPNPVISFNPQSPHFPRLSSILPGSSTPTTMTSTTEEQPSPVPFVTKPRLKPKPRMKPPLGTVEIEAEDEAGSTGLAGPRTSSIVDPLLGVVDDSLVQPNMIITPGGGTTRPDGSSTSNPPAFFPSSLPSSLSAAPTSTTASKTTTTAAAAAAAVPSASTSTLTLTPSLLQSSLPLPSSTSTQMPLQMQGFPQTLTVAEIDQMTSEQAQAIMDQLNAVVSASASASTSASAAPTLAPAYNNPQPSQPQPQPQRSPIPLSIPAMEGIIDLTSESDEPNLTNTGLNAGLGSYGNPNDNTNNGSNDLTAGSMNIDPGDMTDLSEFLNDVDGENWQQILNQFGQS